MESKNINSNNNKSSEVLIKNCKHSNFKRLISQIATLEEIIIIDYYSINPANYLNKSKIDDNDKEKQNLEKECFTEINKSIERIIIPKFDKIKTAVCIVTTKPSFILSSDNSNLINTRNNIFICSKLNEFYLLIGCIIGYILNIKINEDIKAVPGENNQFILKNINYFSENYNNTFESLFSSEYFSFINNIDLESIVDNINRGNNEDCKKEIINSKKLPDHKRNGYNENNNEMENDKIIIEFLRLDFLEVNLECLINDIFKKIKRNKLNSLFENNNNNESKGNNDSSKTKSNFINSNNNKAKNLHDKSDIKSNNFYGNINNNKFNYQNSKNVKKYNDDDLIINSTNINNIAINNKSDLISEIKSSYNYNILLLKVEKYLKSSYPSKYISLRNAIIHISKQNLQLFQFNNYNYSIEEETIAFLLFSSLISNKTIKNELMSKLLRANIVNSFQELESMFTFEIESYIINDLALAIKGYDINNINCIKHVKNNKINSIVENNSKNKISGKYILEYRYLVNNNTYFCNFIKNTVKKILFSFEISKINLLPNNINRLKNMIGNIIKGNELLLIQNNIKAEILVNKGKDNKRESIDYQEIISGNNDNAYNNCIDGSSDVINGNSISIYSSNLITLVIEGLIIEFIDLNLIIVDENNKIKYNMKKIEEKKAIFI